MALTRRLFFVVPHYHAPDADSDLGSRCEPPEHRAAALARTLTALHQTFGSALSVSPGYRSEATPKTAVDVVVVTTGGDHLLAEIGEVLPLVRHIEVDVAPMELGFAAHRVLIDEVGAHEGYGFVEDDVLVHDPLLFDKQRWFTSHFGSDALLQPNRFEASGGLKVYPDGPLGPEATAALSQPPGPARLAGEWFGLDLAFERPSNPHAGCFFVDQEQMARLAVHRGFGVPHASFIRTLETGASGPVAESFRVYKPAPPQGDFLEVEHQGSRYLGLWGVPEPTHVAEASRNAAEANAERAEAELIAMRETWSWRLTLPLRRIGALTRRQR